MPGKHAAISRGPTLPVLACINGFPKLGHSHRIAGGHKETAQQVSGAVTTFEAARRKRHDPAEVAAQCCYRLRPDPTEELDTGFNMFDRAFAVHTGRKFEVVKCRGDLGN